MAVYAPGDDPSDVSSGGFPSWLANLPASIQAQLMRVGNYVNPVSSANAAPASIAASVGQPPNPLTNPSPVDSRLAGGGPPVPASLTGPPSGGPPVAAFNGGGGSSGGGGASGGAWPVGPPGSQPAPAAPPVQMGMPFPPGYGPETTNMPYPGQVDPKGVFAPKPAAQPAVARGGGRTRISPNARAQAPGAAAGNPFTTINRPNMDPGPMYDQQGNPIGPSGGALAGGRGPSGGPPLMTALDLSKLFGRS